jgi:CHAD domain-containing protein
MKASTLPAGTEDINPKRFLKLAHKRLERFVTLLPKVTVSDDPDVIHDLRVASRRLQQALRVITPKPKPAKSKKTIRVLRQVRQALGPCRNLDVNLGLIREKRQHAAAGMIQRAWEMVEGDLEEKRQSLLERARRTVAYHDIFAFIERAKAVLKAADHDDEAFETSAIGKLEETVSESMTTWEEAFATAYEQRDASALHGFRLASKKLRYRAELLVDLGQGNTRPMVDELKKLQRALGDWHDRWVLMRQVAEFVAQPEFLADHPDLSRILLAEMEKEQQRNESAIDQLLSGAIKVQQNWARRKPVRDEAEEKSPH